MAEEEQELPVVRVGFSFSSLDDFDPAEITAFLGVEPSRSYRVGELMPKGNFRRRWTLWHLEIGPRVTYELPEMVDELMAQIRPFEDKIAAVRERWPVEAKLGCNVDLRSRLTPVIYFSPEVCGWAAARGVPIDVDVLAHHVAILGSTEQP